MNPSTYVFQGKAKKDMKINYLTHEQVVHEMNEILKYYNTDVSKADLDKTRKILSKTKTSLNDELSEMREENR